MAFTRFFDALLEGKLIGMKCADCGAYTCPPKASCDNCGSRNLEEVEMEKRGVIKTFTTTYVAPSGYEDEAPYVVAFVELREGAWIVGRLDIDAEVAEEMNQELIGREFELFAKEAKPDPFYPDKKRRVIVSFRLL